VNVAPISAVQQENYSKFGGNMERVIMPRVRSKLREFLARGFGHRDSGLFSQPSNSIAISKALAASTVACDRRRGSAEHARSTAGLDRRAVFTGNICNIF